MQLAVKPLLSRIWHAPDDLRILDPLPPAHRRGIIISAAAIALCFLWPADAPKPAPKSIALHTEDTLPVQASLVVPAYDNTQQSNSFSSQPVALEESAPAPAAEQPATGSETEAQWHTYQIEPGQTMAQLFRDNNLPPTDVYAMAQVEGAGKPLSNLQAGQSVRIRKNSAGVVTGLTIDNGRGDRQVMFIRQANGQFTLSR